MGGWLPFYPVSIGSTVTCLHAWEDLTASLHLAVGATASLSVITGGILTTITPQLTVTNPAVSFSTMASSPLVTITDTGSNITNYDVVIINTPVSVGGIVLFGSYAVTAGLSANSYEITAASSATGTVTNGGAVPKFTTTATSPQVSVLLANHGYSVGSTFPIQVPTTVGGLTLSGFYTVASVTDSSNFIINAANQATSGATAFMNGGNAQFAYYITPGPLPPGTGWGSGGWGSGGWGSGVAPTGATGTPITATDWTLDNFGGTLVACPANGPIFSWSQNSGLYNAQMIANAPTVNTGIFVSNAKQIIVAYGSSVLGIQDPLLINWCDAGNYNTWVASVSNYAGSFRLSKGSKIIGALDTPQYDLFWTDIGIWQSNFIGQPNVFGFTELAEGCGLASKFAMGTLGQTVFWMSYLPASGVAQNSGGQFYALPAGGSVTPVPCTVWDFIFQNIDNANIAEIKCAVNSTFGEIMWFFPVIGGNGQNSAYVKFTPQFNCWDYGYLKRSAWIDQSVFGPPIGADPSTNFIFQHETSNDANGVEMGEYFTTGYWSMLDGQDKAFCDLVYPDMRFGPLGSAQTSTVNLSFTYTDEPTGASIYSTPTYTMTSGGPSYITPRFRARLASLTVGPSTLNTFWRLGGLRIRTASDGRL
jgi:hypothetical protein